MQNPRLHVEKPGYIPILRRTVSLIIFLASANCLAFTWFAMGITWIFDDTGYWPFVECPLFSLNTYRHTPSGPTCHMILRYSVALATSLIQGRLLTAEAGVVMPGLCSLDSVSSPDIIDCYWESDCDSVCWESSSASRCLGSSIYHDPAILTIPGSEPKCSVVIGNLGSQQLPCHSVTVISYCDSAFRVTPSIEIAMRAIVIASALIAVIWLIAELLLRSVEVSMKTEMAMGRAEQELTLPGKIEALRGIVENRWNSSQHADDSISLDSHIKSNSPTVPFASRTMARVPMSPERTETSYRCSRGFSSPLNQVVQSQVEPPPVDRFTSTAWTRRLMRYYKLRQDGKSVYKPRATVRSVCLTIFFFVLIVLTLLMILRMSPQSSPQRGGSSVIDVLSIWEIHSVLDVLIFADVILDFGLFLVASLAITWPKPPIFSKHLELKLAENASDDFNIPKSISSLSRKSSLSSVDAETGSISFVMKQSLTVDCCLMIACHESTITVEKSKSFSHTLTSALKIFPPSHIFVCDNGASVRPVDDTQLVTQAVHPDINYLYVPEGNKTFAFYWCNRYWIPFLEKCRRVPSFRYTLIIDDDVPLPPDLHLPHEHLHQNPDIKAVHFPLTATTPPNESEGGVLVNCQDVEYKLAGLHKQFQSKLSRCFSCHGAIALWDRKAMDEILYATNIFCVNMLI